MQVINHTGILGQINNAIDSATSYIKHIEVSPAEMVELLKDPQLKTYQGKYYGSEEVPVPTSMDKVKEGPITEQNYPKWLWYRGIKIIVVE